MQFDFDDTEREFQQAMRKYALERLAPEYGNWDRGKTLTREWIEEVAGLGLTGLRVPEDYGGVGGSYVLAGIAAEEIARGDQNFTFFVQLSAIAADLLTSYGSERIKAELLPALAAGRCMIAFGLTEPGSGSDAAALKTRATRDGGHWVIDGQKASISFAGLAEHCIVFARTGGEGARGIGAFVVPLEHERVKRRPYSGVGEKLTKRGALYFDAVPVPLDHQLGDADTGFIQAMEAFDYNRALIALTAIGAAQQSIDETVEFARHRETFGKPLARHEGYAFQIAEHSTMLTAARLLAYQTLSLRDRGLPHTKEAAMVKWLGPKVAAEAIHACMILNGWAGYDEELSHGQRLRDAIGFEIGDGTPEIMKAIAAREIFGREFASHK